MVRSVNRSRNNRLIGQHQQSFCEDQPVVMPELAQLVGINGLAQFFNALSRSNCILKLCSFWVDRSGDQF